MNLQSNFFQIWVFGNEFSLLRVVNIWVSDSEIGISRPGNLRSRLNLFWKLLLVNVVFSGSLISRKRIAMSWNLDLRYLKKGTLVLYFRVHVWSYFQSSEVKRERKSRGLGPREPNFWYILIYFHFLLQLNLYIGK